MFTVLSVSEQLFNSPSISASEHYKTDTITSSFTDDGRVSIIEKWSLKFFIDLIVFRAHSCEAKTQTDSMLNDFVLSTIAETIQEVIDNILVVLISMN